MYRLLLGNRVLVVLWSGQAISTVGDVFFNIAAMWVVYAQSHSALQTAIIQAIWRLPVVQAMMWLNLLINVPSFLGPLMPALVRQRLHGGATAYGTLEAVSVIGAAAGGALAGLVERRIGAGRMLATGWGLAGACTVGMAASTAFPLTAALETASAFVLTMGGVSMGALTQALVPEHYRGRVSGITRAMAVVTIPVSALVGGWLADQLGPAPIFAVGGAWILGCTGLAWSNRHVRLARIE